MEEADLWIVREVCGRNDDVNDSVPSARRTAMQVERGSMVLPSTKR